MSFDLEKVVPWGRSFEEYTAMFKLSQTDLKGKILGCGDGPASFNSTLSKQGGSIISFDPIYCFSVEDIQCRIEQTYDEVMDQLRKNRAEFVWEKIKSPEELGRLRMNAMSEFISDFAAGRKQNRYVPGELPKLPFLDQQFDLAVCSHLLFLYSEQLSEVFHLESILELCRVADEVRIFPLLELGAKRSRYLEPITAQLEKLDYVVSIETVPYEFQRNGNQMMKIRMGKPVH